MQTIEGSPALSFSQSDFGKVLKGAGIAAAGAIAAYVLQASGGWDFGPWTFVVVPLLSTAANALLKWLTNTTAIVRKEVAVLVVAAMIASTASAADVTRNIGTRSYTLHSPARLTTPSPVLIQHGTRDLIVPLADARAAEAAWKRTGAAVEFVAYTGVGHQWPAGASDRVAAFCKLTPARAVPASFRADEFTVTVVSMKGCKPCASLKQAFATSEYLKPYAAKIVDKDESRELVRSLGIKSFPTLLVQTHGAKLVYRKIGFDGNAKKLADEIAAAIKRYKPPQRRGVRIGRRMANDPRLQVFTV